MSDRPEIYNGQVWRQDEFPCFTVMVLMLSHINHVLMFCKVGVGDRGGPPMVMDEEDGTWMYSAEDLLKQLRDRKYTEIGVARVEITPRAKPDISKQQERKG